MSPRALAALVTLGSLATTGDAAPLGPDYLLASATSIPITKDDPRGGASRLRLAAAGKTVEIGYAVPLDPRGLGDEQRPIELVVVEPDGTATSFARLPQRDDAGDRYVFAIDKGRSATAFVVRGTTRHVLPVCPRRVRAGTICTEFRATRWPITWSRDGTFAVGEPQISRQVIASVSTRR